MAISNITAAFVVNPKNMEAEIHSSSNAKGRFSEFCISLQKIAYKKIPYTKVKSLSYRKNELNVIYQESFDGEGITQKLIHRHARRGKNVRGNGNEVFLELPKSIPVAQANINVPSQKKNKI